MKTKQKVTETVNTTKRVVENAEKFVQAIALLVLVGFSYSNLHKVNLSEAYQWVITGALVIVGLRAFVELVKFLDTERK